MQGGALPSRCPISEFEPQVRTKQVQCLQCMGDRGRKIRSSRPAWARDPVGMREVKGVETGDQAVFADRNGEWYRHAQEVAVL